MNARYRETVVAFTNTNNAGTGTMYLIRPGRYAALPCRRIRRADGHRATGQSHAKAAALEDRAEGGVTLPFNNRGCGDLG